MTPQQEQAQRYDLITNYRCGTSIDEMERADDGEWVRWEDVQAELAALRSELQRLKIAISPRHGESWSVNQLVTLADAHREDSETIDRYELPTSDAYATSYDYDAAALERRVALQRMTEERDEWRHAYYDLAKEYGRG